MNWNCEGEHRPTPIGEGVYCAKCGTKLPDSTPIPFKNMTPSQFLNAVSMLQPDCDLFKTN